MLADGLEAASLRLAFLTRGNSDHGIAGLFDRPPLPERSVRPVPAGNPTDPLSHHAGRRLTKGHLPTEGLE